MVKLYFHFPLCLRHAALNKLKHKDDFIFRHFLQRRLWQARVLHTSFETKYSGSGYMSYAHFLIILCYSALDNAWSKCSVVKYDSKTSQQIFKYLSNKPAKLVICTKKCMAFGFMNSDDFYGILTGVQISWGDEDPLLVASSFRVALWNDMANASYPRAIQFSGLLFL
jgi:hypothetical protein